MKSPGINREQRISDDGLVRLKKQLQSGRKISKVVLDQWVKRYGEQAQKIINDFL